MRSAMTIALPPSAQIVAHRLGAIAGIGRERRDGDFVRGAAWTKPQPLA